MTTTNDHVTVALKGEPYLKVLLFNKVEDKEKLAGGVFFFILLSNVYPYFFHISFLTLLF